MNKIIQISDSSLNIGNIISNMEFKKWKNVILDSSLNTMDHLAPEGYLTNPNAFTEGSILSETTGLTPKQYAVDSSGLITIQRLPENFIMKGIGELFQENSKLKNRTTELENLVNQLITIIDPSIN